MKKHTKLIALLLSFALIASVFTAGSMVSARRYGDSNGDGDLNLLDLITMRKHLAKWNVEINMRNADMNDDGSVNLLDLLVMRKVLVHLLPDLGEIDDDIDYGEVPADYSTETIKDVAVNQIGYVPSADKIARILVPESKLKYTCYVVNKKTGKVVYSGESSSSARVDSLLPNNYMLSFDFSKVKEEGEYYIATPIGRSVTITISKQPYNELQDKITNALYYQRCGSALDASIVGDTFAHSGCHNASNAKAYFLTKLCDDPNSAAYNLYMVDDSKTVSADKLSGGLHDAGDYGRYTTPANGVVALLLYATELSKDGCTTNVITDKAGENIPDTLDQARYQMKWLLKMQDKETGGVYSRIVTKAFANYVQPQYDNLYNNGLYVSRATCVATAGFAGNAASCYTAFKNIDPEFAKQCLDAAKLAYDYLEKNADSTYRETKYEQNSEYNGANAGEYEDGAYAGEYYYAAAALFRATGDSKYNEKVKTIYKESVTDAPDYLKTNLYAINANDIGGAGTMAYLLNPNADKTLSAEILKSIGETAKSVSDKVNARTNKYSCPIDLVEHYWGSNNTIMNRAYPCIMYNYFTKTNTYEKAIRKINDYILGSNESNYSFVTCCGENSVQHPHHRQSMSAGKCIPGMVVGGINVQAKSSPLHFEDNADMYVYNEPCVYLNSECIFNVAYLVALDKAAK